MMECLKRSREASLMQRRTAWMDPPTQPQSVLLCRWKELPSELLGRPAVLVMPKLVTNDMLGVP